ncbi:CvpA family protein [Gaetbulibacter aestuarii]|uniref:CvpA family protein n=1 Tax=Gaetbulibacter aestuarii TaxID=1502358 RepID=A0ABW7MW44_9FLAO
MSAIDIVLLILIGFGIWRGFKNGLFVEIASIVALVAGVFGAIYFSHYAGDFLKEQTSWEEKTIQVAAFIITFVIIVAAISLAGKALTKLADFAALGIINKIFGAVFGALKIALILSIILVIFDRLNKEIPFMEKSDLEGSVLYIPVKSLVPAILPNILTINGELVNMETEKAKEEANDTP